MYGNSNVRLPFFPVSHVSGSYPTLRSTRTPPASSTPRKPIGFKVQSTGTPRKLNASIIELEAQLAHVNVHLRDERSAPEQDLIDYRAGLLHPRTELYSEMLRGVCATNNAPWSILGSPRSSRRGISAFTRCWPTLVYPARPST